jgi:NADPH:quinone reductase
VKAIEIVTLDGPSALRLVEKPDPTGKVVIDVHAAGVAFPETLLSRGLYQLKPDLPFTPGSECAGVVRHAAEGSGFVVGQRVAAFPGLGGFSEQVALHPSMVFPLPDSLSCVEGAALPLNYLTMHFALHRRARLRADETVLVHGAAGGIGTAAIQLAKAHGARVIGVVSTEAKRSIAARAGADEVLLSDGFLDGVRELKWPVDVVVDPVGGDRFTDSLRVLAPEGRLLVIGFTAGDIPSVKVNRLLLNNISVVGVGWGAFWMGARPEFVREQWNAMVPAIEAGLLKPVVTNTYPLAEAAAAVSALEERAALGKIVLEVQ